MKTPRSSTETLIGALRVLAHEIQSNDGVANMAILEASNRLEEFNNMFDEMLKECDRTENESGRLLVMKFMKDLE